MPTAQWVNPSPAQETDFLQLHYENQYGYPEGATTAIYQHPWSRQDWIGLAAEMEIVRATDDGYRVRFIQYSWPTLSAGASPDWFEIFDGCSRQLWESHETFGRFTDAEAYALFCWARWRATGSAGSAGMHWRDDLDSNLNPA
jgi:hypothetical protein